MFVSDPTETATTLSRAARASLSWLLWSAVRSSRAARRDHRARQISAAGFSTPLRSAPRPRPCRARARYRRRRQRRHTSLEAVAWLHKESARRCRCFSFMFSLPAAPWVSRRDSQSRKRRHSVRRLGVCTALGFVSSKSRRSSLSRAEQRRPRDCRRRRPFSASQAWPRTSQRHRLAASRARRFE